MSTFYQSPVSGKHPDLNDRDLADQHPISAITGLTDALEQAVNDAVDEANTYADNAIAEHNENEETHADIRQKIADDIIGHNEDEDAHADIRQKITDDIGTHNEDEDAHSAIRAAIPTQIGEHNAAEDAHADIRQYVDDAMAIAQGASIAKVFDTYDGTDETALVWWLENEALLEDIRIGQDFFIKDLGVPDYWWTGNWTDGNPESGLSILSNQQITMDVYYTKSQVDTLLSAKATVASLNALIAVVDGKADQSALNSLSTTVGNKVDKVSGKGLSANDYTNADKNKVALIDTLGDGDLFLSDDGTYKAISGGGSSRNVVSSTDTSATISSPNANTTYLFENPLTALTIDGSIPNSDDEILIQFKSGTTPTSLAVPVGIKAITAIPTIEADTWYEISIRNDIWAFSQGLN